MGVLPRSYFIGRGTASMLGWRGEDFETSKGAPSGLLWFASGRAGRGGRFSAKEGKCPVPEVHCYTAVKTLQMAGHGPAGGCGDGADKARRLGNARCRLPKEQRQGKGGELPGKSGQSRRPGCGGARGDDRAGRVRTMHGARGATVKSLPLPGGAGKCRKGGGISGSWPGTALIKNWRRKADTGEGRCAMRGLSPISRG